MNVMDFSPAGFKRFVNNSERETVSELLTADLGYPNIPAAEHVLGKLGTDISNCKPRELTTKHCKELLGILRQAVRNGVNEAVSEPNKLPRKVSEIDLDLLEA